jgi:hypothetical protein
MSDNPTPLNTASTDELIDELVNRCAAIVIGLQLYNEESADATEPMTQVIVSGNFVHTTGLATLVRHKTDSHIERLSSKHD